LFSFAPTDTLDLQDHVAPSAQDHRTKRTRLSDTPPDALSLPIAPHQAETLRDVAHEIAKAEAHKPQVSWSNDTPIETDQLLQQGADDDNATDNQNLAGAGPGTDMYQQDQQDALAIAQNGGVVSVDEDDLEDEAEGEDLDDDLMDKISSSPSIEDGALNPAEMPAAWPRRESSLTSFSRQLDTAKLLPESVQPVVASNFSYERNLPDHETSVSRYPKADPVAEWQHWLYARRQYKWSSLNGRQDCNDECETLIEWEAQWDAGHRHRSMYENLYCFPYAVANWPQDLMPFSRV
jgi:hypothetical protein